MLRYLHFNSRGYYLVCQFVIYELLCNITWDVIIFKYFFKSAACAYIFAGCNKKQRNFSGPTLNPSIKKHTAGAGFKLDQNLFGRMWGFRINLSDIIDVQKFTVRYHEFCVTTRFETALSEFIGQYFLNFGRQFPITTSTPITISIILNGSQINPGSLIQADRNEKALKIIQKQWRARGHNLRIFLVHLWHGLW